MTYKQTAKVDVAIVTLADMKTFLRVSGSSEDDLIQSLIDAAENTLEIYMNRDILTATYENYRNSFIEDLTLRRGKYQSVVKVEYFDYDTSAYVELASTDYKVTIGGIYGRITEIDPVPDYTANSNGDNNYVKITFKSGFGDTADDVPEAIKTAIKMLTNYWYANRGDCSNDKTTIPMSIQALVKAYKIVDIVGERTDDCM